MRDEATWTAVSVDDVEAIDWRRTGIVWRPVRGALGTTIVGMAAYTAATPGQTVVERHVETRDGRGQEEVYVVLRGRARFMIDDDQLDASAGTLVRVAPEASREAVALEAGTAVLALGGESWFEPGASEWIERARPHLRDEPARAREILDELRHERPDDAANWLETRCWRSVRGMTTRRRGSSRRCSRPTRRCARCSLPIPTSVASSATAEMLDLWAAAALEGDGPEAAAAEWAALAVGERMAAFDPVLVSSLASGLHGAHHRRWPTAGS